MLNVLRTIFDDPLPEPGATLWHCDICDTFVSIRSTKPVQEVLCPVCGDLNLEFRGSFSKLPGVQFGNA